MPSSALPFLQSLCAFLCLASFALPSRGSERLLTAHLDWNAPLRSNCPTAKDMVQAVEVRLGRTVFVQGGSADVQLIVKIDPSGASWRAQLELLDAAQRAVGTRTLHSKSRDCAALNEVLPVVVALLVDATQQHVALELPQPNPTPPNNGRNEVSASLDSQASKQPPRAIAAPSASLGVGWTASFEGVYDLLPGVSPGAKLLGFVEPEGLQAPLEFWLSVLSSSDGPAALRMTIMQLGAGVCPKLWRGSVTWMLCPGFDVGAMQSFGRGFDVNLSSRSFHFDVRTWTQLDVPIARPWFVRLEAGALFPLIRRRFMGEREPQVPTLLHRPAAIAPFLAVGVGVGFR